MRRHCVFYISIAVTLFSITTDSIDLYGSSGNPVVYLWTIYRSLTPEDIDRIPVNKINTVLLNFNFPVWYPDSLDTDHLSGVIEHCHRRGLKVFAFIGVEMYPSGIRKRYKALGLPVPLRLSFDEMVNADGSFTLKWGGRGTIASFWDEQYRQYMGDKIRLINGCHPDYIIAGEWGYMGSDIRDYSPKALAAFIRETGTELPTTRLSEELQGYMDSHPQVRKGWFLWKCSKVYNWFSSLPIDGVGRAIYEREEKFISPVFEKGKINWMDGGFRAKDRDYDEVAKRIELLRVPGQMNFSSIQFSIGNTGENILNPEDITNRALFLVRDQKVNGFNFYGSAYWKRYTDYVEYLPDLEEY